MPDELTPKQEAFCLAYIETGNASEAYRRAYDVSEGTKPDTVWNEASRLLRNPDVTARVKELQQEARDLLHITIGSLTDKLEDARLHAMKDDKGASAAVSAIMGMAKLHGLLVEKAEVTGKDGAPLVPDPSPIDIAKALIGVLTRAYETQPPEKQQ